MGINAQGFGLPLPQAPFPVTITSQGLPQWNGTNKISLQGGGSVLIPPGRKAIDLGTYSVLQYLDPVTNIWSPFGTDDQNGHRYVNSDGFNFRVVNPTGCVVAVLLTNGGTGYTTTTAPAVSFSSGGALATAIVGGAIGAIVLSPLSTLTVTSGAGGNFTYAPIVNIAAPPQGGIQATAVANLSGTQLNAGAPFTITNQGAGYAFAPAVTIIQNPADPSTTIRQANVVASLTGATSVTGVLVTNYGNGVLQGVPSVTIAAPTAGVQAAGTAICALAITSAAAATIGSNYGSAFINTYGGITAGTPAYTNPDTQTNMYQPRQAQFSAALASGNLGTITVLDGGIFQTAPSTTVLGPGINPAQIVGPYATVTLGMGAYADTVTCQDIAGG